MLSLSLSPSLSPLQANCLRCPVPCLSNPDTYPHPPCDLIRSSLFQYELYNSVEQYYNSSEGSLEVNANGSPRGFFNPLAGALGTG